MKTINVRQLIVTVFCRSLWVSHSLSSKLLKFSVIWTSTQRFRWIRHFSLKNPQNLLILEEFFTLFRLDYLKSNCCCPSAVQALLWGMQRSNGYVQHESRAGRPLSANVSFSRLERVVVNHAVWKGPLTHLAGQQPSFLIANDICAISDWLSPNRIEQYSRVVMCPNT